MSANRDHELAEFRKMLFALDHHRIAMEAGAAFHRKKIGKK
jgi:hypothetical protein